MRTNKFAALVTSLLVLAALTGCSGQLSQGPTPTPGPSPVPTPVSFADKDLSKIVLQASDLPRGYAVASQISKPSDLEQVFGDNLGVHADLVAGQDVAYALGSSETGVTQLFDNALFVYADATEAGLAYQTLSASFAGDRLDFPPLGSESVASQRETPAIGNPNATRYTVAVVWRQDSAVILLDSVGGQVTTQQMAGLANAIQGRILRK